MTTLPSGTPMVVGHGARPLASESHWLLSTAGKWTEEDEKEWKRQQHRENMVFFRRKKKEQQAELRSQHQQLELRLQQHLAMQRRAASRASTSRHEITNTSQKQGVLRDLVAEREALKTENAALRDEIDKHEKLRDFVRESSEGLRSHAQQRVSSASSQEGSNSDSSTSTCSSSSSSSVAEFMMQHRGWRVQFPGGEPSFHFHPFTKPQLDAIRQGYDSRFAVNPHTEEVGSLFGWQVKRAPLVQHPTLNVLVSRVRYSRRIHCAGGSAQATMKQLDSDSWTVLTTPELWARIHNNSMTSQVLQVLDEDTHVLVRNTFERSMRTNVRYLNLVSRRRTQHDDGRRSITYAMVVVTSDANRRSQEAEPHRDVYWVNEGGAYMTLSQIDDTTLEVVYDHCSGCMSEQHAQFCLIEWGHIVVRWEQLVTPSRLLAL